MSNLFCNECGNILDIGSRDRVACDVCGRVQNVDGFVVVTQSRPNAFQRRKATEEESSSTGATIDEKCVKCGNAEMSFHTMQLRSADEGQTVFYTCLKCGYKYSVNS